MDELKEIIRENQEGNHTEKYQWIKKELFPNSQEYLELKAACLRGDYTMHFVEHNFKNFDNAEKIFLYEHISNNYKDILAYQTIMDDANLFKHKECIVLYDVAKVKNVPTEEIEKVMNDFAMNASTYCDLTLRIGIKNTIEIKILCC